MIFAEGISVIHASRPGSEKCQPYDVSTFLAWNDGKSHCLIHVFFPHGHGEMSFDGADHAGVVGARQEHPICDVNHEYHVKELVVQGVRGKGDSPFFDYTFMDENGNTLFTVAVRTPGELAALARTSVRTNFPLYAAMMD